MGLDDLIVGAYGANPNGIDSGKAYIIFGKTDTNAVDLAKLGADSKYTIDYLGDENANTLTGTRSDEIFVAGAGDDTLTGNGGMDVFNAGLLVLVEASNKSSKLNFRVLSPEPVIPITDIRQIIRFDKMQRSYFSYRAKVEA
jgi:Ca2+-binding RTX toxin-like protein